MKFKDIPRNRILSLEEAILIMNKMSTHTKAYHIKDFSDYKKAIDLTSGIGSTCARINQKLIEKHEPYFKQAYENGFYDACGTLRAITDEMIVKLGILLKN